MTSWNNSANFTDNKHNAKQAKDGPAVKYNTPMDWPLKAKSTGSVALMATLRRTIKKLSKNFLISVELRFLYETGFCF